MANSQNLIPFQKGHPKLGGRTKGTRNKVMVASETFRRIGLNTLAEMYKMWKDPKTEDAVKARLLCEMASYQFPKLKSLDHNVSVRQVTLIITGA